LCLRGERPFSRLLRRKVRKATRVYHNGKEAQKPALTRRPVSSRYLIAVKPPLEYYSGIS
jgi:hypothetical protein